MVMSRLRVCTRHGTCVIGSKQCKVLLRWCERCGRRVDERLAMDSRWSKECVSSSRIR